MAEYKLVVWQEPQGLVFQDVRKDPFMAFSAGDHIDSLNGAAGRWLIEAVSHSLYDNGGLKGHQVSLIVKPA